METDQSFSAIDGNSDFACLRGADDYSRYFNLLARAFALQAKCHRLAAGRETYEASRIQQFLQRLLFTVETLRMKYSHHPTDRRRLWVDLSESGFPNAREIDSLNTELLHRDSRLRELPTATLLKQLMLDHMFRYRTEPEELLRRMAERTYLGMLSEEELFLPFVAAAGDPGSPAEGKDGVRQYRCAWGCYDFSTNRPYLHFMTFDQDVDAEPLEPGTEAAAQLLEVLRAEGSRAPDVAILAMAIDRALESIHPKILKRICLGPLYTRTLLEHEDLGEPDDKHRALLSLFRIHAKENDFILFSADEIVFSRRQEITRTVFAPQGRVREIFLILETDPECYRRRASVVHKQALMPHALAQHLVPKISHQVPELDGARLLTYDERGDVHGF